MDAVATALVFFHKFFMLHSFNKHERLFVASACLFLAAKVEVRSRYVHLTYVEPRITLHRCSRERNKRGTLKGFCPPVCFEAKRSLGCR